VSTAKLTDNWRRIWRFLKLLAHQRVNHGEHSSALSRAVFTVVLSPVGIGAKLSLFFLVTLSPCHLVFFHRALAILLQVGYVHS
jgi:hypothetical protein